MKHLKRAKEIISEVLYINLATVTPDGKPWNSVVYTAFDEQYNFYWASWTENEHSKNISHNPHVFATIYDSTVPESNGEGVYMQGAAVLVERRSELEHALKHYYARKNKTPRRPEDFLGNSPRRIYKFTPEKTWLNIGGKVHGHYVDQRIEVSL